MLVVVNLPSCDLLLRVVKSEGSIGQNLGFGGLRFPMRSCIKLFAVRVGFLLDPADPGPANPEVFRSQPSTKVLEGPSCLSAFMR